MSDLVLDFFGFSSYPFSKTIGYKNIFSTKTNQEAHSRLEFGIISEDILLLTGPVGVGKSICLNSFVHTVDSDKYTVVYLRGNGMTHGELYKAILDGLKIDPPYLLANAKRLFFKKIPELTKKPLIVIDDSQDLKDLALMNIKSMVNFDFDSRNHLTFILAGQPELRKKLTYSSMQALRQRIRISYELMPMSLEETCSYIDHQTKICGNQNSIFSSDAKMKIFKTSEGIPRRINSICFKAIIKAACDKCNIIDSSNIATDDLD
jgi:type II secretory pathway predicted ATPase ExeA